MNLIKQLFSIFLLINSILIFSQTKPNAKKIRISGKIIEKTSNQPLEYATVTLINQKNQKALFGGITDNQGKFIIDANTGIFDIKVEFFGFKALLLKNQNLIEDQNLETIFLQENPSELKEVVVRAETSTVEIKLDKKVYNVGKDMIVKGGTANDVLSNVPSVTVDGDGNVSLRGNENVKIFIDGKPSNAVNIATALQQISADAIDKVEVISNPSARYDAEGGAGILNIILKKGKTNGLNGSVIATIGNPKNLNFQSNVNFKSEKFNFFSNFGINNSIAPGNFLTNSNYYDANKNVEKSIFETRTNDRERYGHNYNFGIENNINATTTWTNALSFRKNDGSNPEDVNIENKSNGGSFIKQRQNRQKTEGQNAEFTSNFSKKFKKEGHKLTADFLASIDKDNDMTLISDFLINQPNVIHYTSTKNFQNQYKQLIQVDYVLPLGKSSQFETGFKGDINKLKSDFGIGKIDNSGNFTANLSNTNIFNYKENINAVYTQFGSKYKKLSYLIGIRFEDSKVSNSLATTAVNEKHYQNWFPSAFLTYPISDISTISLNYSKRITRPRNRFINPFSGIESDINIFQGNPDINPSLTDALDFAYLTKVKKVLLSTSIYFNNTRDPFQFTRRRNGDLVNNVPVLVSTPINLGTDQRIGFEFTANFSPIKWWKINTNFNFFQNQLKGNFNYKLNNSNQIITESFDRNSSNWFVKLNSKISLPFKIDWQTNGIYTAPQLTPQGETRGVYTVNLAFSKDILKDKGTISLNVSDLFNSTKMMREFDLPTVNSYTEFQRRERQINLNFAYRFNKKKVEREKSRNENDGGGGEF